MVLTKIKEVLADDAMHDKIEGLGAYRSTLNVVALHAFLAKKIGFFSKRAVFYCKITLENTSGNCLV